MTKYEIIKKLEEEEREYLAEAKKVGNSSRNGEYYHGKASGLRRAVEIIEGGRPEWLEKIAPPIYGIDEKQEVTE